MNHYNSTYFEVQKTLHVQCVTIGSGFASHWLKTSPRCL